MNLLRDMSRSKISRSLGLFMILLLGCDYDGYHFIGTFPVRVAAENQALGYLAEEYDELPNDSFKKVFYGYHKNNATTRNAIWYNKTTSQLGIERDFKKGCSCLWTGINRVVLERLVSDKKGLFNAKYLANPNPITCQKEL